MAIKEDSIINNDGASKTCAENLRFILNSYILKREINLKLKKFGIFNHWSDIVGSDVAKRTKPIKISKDTLIIKVANSVWANELSLMSRQILKKINDFVGEEVIKDLKFRLN